MLNPLADNKKKRVLTEKQAAFIDALLGPAEGNLSKAAKLAGYSETMNPYHVADALQEEIIDAAKAVLANNSIKAAFALTNALGEGATQPGVTARLTAAQQVLDRIGIVKHDKLDVNIETPSGIFILPPKKEAPVAPQAQ